MESEKKENIKNQNSKKVFKFFSSEIFLPTGKYFSEIDGNFFNFSVPKIIEHKNVDKKIGQKEVEKEVVKAPVISGFSSLLYSTTTPLDLYSNNPNDKNEKNENNKYAESNKSNESEKKNNIQNLNEEFDPRSALKIIFPSADLFQDLSLSNPGNTKPVLRYEKT